MGRQVASMLDLAEVQFEDTLNSSLDDIRGAAALLAMQDDLELEALHMLSEVLYDRVKKIQVAYCVMREVAANEGGEATVTPEVSEAAVKDPSVLVSAADSTEQPTKRTDEEIGLYAVAGAAHIDALSARAALGRLVSLIVQGELDPSVDTDMDSIALFARGIEHQIDDVTEALDSLVRRLGKQGA